jgi:hypothetical protein
VEAGVDGPSEISVPPIATLSTQNPVKWTPAS